LGVPIRWLLAPWQRTGALVQQIAQLELIIAGQVVTLQRLQNALDYDGLTGAHSRLYFLAALRQEVARFVRDDHTCCGKGFTVGLLDVDHFKRINDRLGHEHGDQALLEVVETAHRILRRDCDVFARYGGDEFAFLLPQTPIEGAHKIAERLRGAVAARALGVGRSPLTLSIGVASYQSGDTVETLLRAADEALYRAKGTRNAVCFARDPLAEHIWQMTEAPNR
jgi:diguanylate cyclase (GGDEF)-like protein